MGLSFVNLNAASAVFRDAVRQFDLIRREREQRLRIEQLTLTDPLTGCLSRLQALVQLQAALDERLCCCLDLAVGLTLQDAAHAGQQRSGRPGVAGSRGVEAVPAEHLVR